MSPNTYSESVVYDQVYYPYVVECDYRLKVPVETFILRVMVAYK